MSVQDRIDWFLSKEGKYLRTITIKGESGDAVVPNNCAITFTDCNLGSVSVAESCVVVICKSKMAGPYNQTGGSLTLDRVDSSEMVQLDGVKATIKYSDFLATFSLKNGSYSEFYFGSHPGSNGEVAILAEQNSKIVLINTSIPGTFPIAIRLLSGSHLSARKATIIGVQTGLEAFDFSQAEVYQGRIQGLGKYAVDCKTSSSVVISSPDTPVQGILSAILAEDSSSVRVVNADQISGDLTALQASRGSTIDTANVRDIVGNGNVAVRLDEGSTVRVTKTVTLHSEGSHAVLGQNASNFIARDIGSIRSQAGDGLNTTEGCVVELSNVDEILGQAGDGIHGGDNDQYTIRTVRQIRGQAGEGISGGDGFVLTAVDVGEILGQTSHGVSIANDSKITINLSQKIEGLAGHGVSAGNDCTIVLSGVDEVLGHMKDGIHVGNGCTVRYSRGKLIYGKEGRAVTAGSRCDLSFEDFADIIGELEECILCSKSSVRVVKGSKVRSQTSGAAIKVEGSGGKVYVRDVVEMHGTEGAGIRVNSGTIDVADMGELSGGGFALVGTEGTSILVRRIDNLKGGDGAANLQGESSLDLRGVDFLGGGGDAIKCDSSTADVSSVGSIEATNVVLASNGSTVYLRNVKTTSGDFEVDSKSTLDMSNVEVVGTMLLDDSAISISSCTIEGDITSNSASLRCSNVEITGAVTIVDGSVSLQSTSLSGALTATDAAILGCKFSSESCTLTDSGFVGASCTLGAVTMVVAGVILAQGAAALTGEGGAYLAEAGAFVVPVVGAFTLSPALTLMGNPVDQLTS